MKVGDLVENEAGTVGVVTKLHFGYVESHDIWAKPDRVVTSVDVVTNHARKKTWHWCKVINESR